MIQVRFRVNSKQLDAALRQYARLSKSEHQDIVNRKAFFIARGACRETKRADPKDIRALRERTVLGTGTSYKSGKPKQFTLRSSLASTLAARILIGRRVKAGEAVPTKKALTKLVSTFIAARLRSRAYLAAGWLPAIKTLDRVVKRKSGAPSIGPRPKIFGREKGRATPATSSFRAKAVIENATGMPGKFSKNHSKALQKYGEPALQLAIDRETIGTLAEIARRLKSAAASAGIRTA